MSGSIIKTGSLITPGGATGSVGAPGRDSQEIGSIKAWPSNTIPPSWDIADGGELVRTQYPELFALVGTSFGTGNGTTTFNKPDLRGRFILGAGAGAGLTSRLLAAKAGEENHTLTVAEMPAHAHTDSGHAHYCSGVDHLHSMQNHVHGMDHYHNVDFGQINHAHTIWGYTNSNATAGGGGGYSVANSSGPTSTATFGVGSSAWASQTNGNWVNTAGPNVGTTAAADRSLAFNSNNASAAIQNTGGSGIHNNMPPFLVLVYIIKLSSTGGPTAQAPLADTTQDGLLRKVSGKLGDFVDGTNRCQDLTNFVSNLIPAIPVIPPPADATQDGLLRKVSGLTSDFVDGTNNCRDFTTAVRNVSTAVRSYNAIGNPNFEIDQRTCGTGATGSGWGQDRWFQFKNGTAATSAVQTNGIVTIPGTNFPITNQFLRMTLTTQEPSLAAASSSGLIQYVEGTRLRELISDKHSISLLVRCSSPLKFSVALRDNAAAYTLSKLATIPAAGVWTIIPLPNLPIWTPNAIWSTAPGANGYQLFITLTAGASSIPASNDIWVAGANGFGAIGQDNFGALPLNTTFDIAFVQHEPGSICSGFIDLPFDRNLDECLRYYSKSTNYNQKIGSGGADCGIGCIVLASQGYIASGFRFPKRMAKVPSVGIWNRGNTAQNALTTVGGVAVTINGVGGISENGIGWTTSTPAFANAWDWMIFHFHADTGW